jgi:hypothetical protein
MDVYHHHLSVNLPENYCQEDEVWIREMLLNLDASTRNKITFKYSQVYSESWENEPIIYKKENKARNSANTRLREFVRKYAEFSKGKVSNPEVFNPH